MLKEAVESINRRVVTPLDEDGLEQEVSTLTDFEIDGITRLDELREVLGDKTTGNLTLLQTPEGNLVFNGIHFALLKKKTFTPITHREFVNVAKDAGTDVKGIINAFVHSFGGRYSERDEHRMWLLGNDPIPAQTKEQIASMIKSNHSRVYHGILY